MSHDDPKSLPPKPPDDPPAPEAPPSGTPPEPPSDDSPPPPQLPPPKPSDEPPKAPLALLTEDPPPAEPISLRTAAAGRVPGQPAFSIRHERSEFYQGPVPPPEMIGAFEEVAKGEGVAMLRQARALVEHAIATEKQREEDRRDAQLHYQYEVTKDRVFKQKILQRAMDMEALDRERSYVARYVGMGLLFLLAVGAMGLAFYALKEKDTWVGVGAVVGLVATIVGNAIVSRSNKSNQVDVQMPAVVPSPPPALKQKAKPKKLKPKPSEPEEPEGDADEDE